ncbi:hypothetical protein ACHQM5_020171 [Ranunculus cassubicifolius]
MEQANYWMWMRRTLSEKSHVETSRNYNDSWEEQAFAEDSAGPLGGCIWPPRSYSCSFCRREFRSAQALGGHMNVHRRDRARLKQSPIPHTENGVIQPSTSMATSLLQYPSSSSSQVCTLSYSNPKFNPRLSCDDHALVQGHRMIGSLFSRQSPAVAIKVTSLSDSKLEGGKNLRAQEIEFGLKSDSDVSLNLAVRRTRPTQSSGDDEDEVISNKRRKVVDAAASLPFFLSPKHQSSSSIEEIDLELRLGHRPKVK